MPAIQVEPERSADSALMPRVAGRWHRVRWIPWLITKAQRHSEIRSGQSEKAAEFLREHVREVESDAYWALTPNEWEGTFGKRKTYHPLRSTFAKIASSPW